MILGQQRKIVRPPSADRAGGARFSAPMAVARFCDKNGNFDMGKLAAVVSHEKESSANDKLNALKCEFCNIV